jgi:hypothetical protein
MDGGNSTRIFMSVFFLITIMRAPWYIRVLAEQRRSSETLVLEWIIAVAFVHICHSDHFLNAERRGVQ